jgi:hypothetical protein
MRKTYTATDAFTGEKIRVNSEPAPARKIWMGVVPDIFGYGMTVVSDSAEGARKALKAEYHRWKAQLKEYADPTTTFGGSFVHYGGRIFQVELDKVYYDNFGS